MTYLLDTCIISKMRKIKAYPDPILKNWILNHEERSFYISVLSLGEIQAGIAKLNSTIADEQKKRMLLEDWLFGELASRFKGRILDITLPIAFTWGKLNGSGKQNGKNIPVIDGFIAATAIHHSLIVVTENVKDFLPLGVEVFNPYEAATQPPEKRIKTQR